jgi:hypothetical protein
MAQNESGKKKKPSKHDELVRMGARVADLWMEFRKHFRLAYVKRPIARAEEQMFLDIKSEMARLQRALAHNLPEGFRYGSKRITDIMAQSISISALRDLPSADKKALYQRWHEAYIALQNLLGTLDILQEGYPVRFQVAKARTGNVKADLAGPAKKKHNVKNVLAGMVAIAIVAAFIWWIGRQ